MLKGVLAATALLTAGFISVDANAANVIYGDSVYLSGGESFPPAPGLTWLGVDSVDLSALPQFDPALGMLTGVNLSIVGNLYFGADVTAWDVSDGEVSHSMQANGLVGLTAEVPASGGTLVRPYTTAGITVSCSDGPYSGPCFDFAEENQAIAISGNFADAELAAFLGGGDLSDVNVNLLLALDSLYTDNVDDPEASIFVDFSGDVIVDYQFTIAPVPLPAAVWMLGSALAGLVGLKRLRRAPGLFSE